MAVKAVEGVSNEHGVEGERVLPGNCVEHAARFAWEVGFGVEGDEL